jgi:nitrite reductase/ring-hydroxylating ferredoxin subunit
MTSKIPSGQARCPGDTVQEIIHRDGRYVPPVLAEESYTFLGDTDIPFERYTSRQFFDLEMEKLWPRVWQWVCREEHIPEPGDYITYDIGVHSFLVVRTEAREIRAYYNSCLHRGTKLRPSESQGYAQSLRCPYHGWTWTLEGKLKEIPCRWDFPHVEEEQFRLPEVRVAVWGGFVFINMDPEAPDLETFMEVLPDHFKDWNMEKRYVELHIEKELPCNWKTALEAFLESYHVLETHPQLLQGVGDANVQYDTYGDHVSRFVAALGVSSPHLEKPLSEQELVDMMLVGDRSVLTDELTLGEGETARVVMARFLRKSLAEKYRTNLEGYSDSEVIDTIEYHLFPNMVLFPGISLPMVYRFRPLDNDPDRCLFDLLFLRPVPDDGSAPEPAEPVRLKVADSYTSVEGMDRDFGAVYDQDTNNLRGQQEGFKAAKKRGQTLGNYQESRIRHFHLTLDKYLVGEASGA